MISWSALLVWAVSVSVSVSQTSINMTVTCTSCYTYQMTTGNTNLTMSCPRGTYCSSSNSSFSCAANNPCNGVVCDHYDVFPSPDSCQTFYICRFIPSAGGWVLGTNTCPGTSKFDANSRKCSFSSYVKCYNASAVG